MSLPWNYLVVAKSFAARKNWYQNEAEITLAIQRRSVRTKDGETPFEYFDGATMVGYQNPSKRVETVFCRQNPEPTECDDMRGFDLSIPNAPIQWFEVKSSLAGDSAGRGMFTTQDIPEESYIAIDAGVHSLYFPPKTFDLIHDFEMEKGEYLEAVEEYMHGYGFQSDHHVSNFRYLFLCPA